MSVTVKRTLLAAAMVVAMGIGVASAYDTCNPCTATIPAPAPVVQTTAICGDPCLPAPAPAPVVQTTTAICDPCAPAPAPVPVVRTVVAAAPVCPPVRYVVPTRVDRCDPCGRRSGRSWRWFGWFRRSPQPTYYSYNRNYGYPHYYYR